MKFLFIRLFLKKKDQIPFDSWPVCGEHNINSKTLNKAEVLETITNWMLSNPEGKIDFIVF